MSPVPFGDPQRLRAEDKISNGPQQGVLAKSPCRIGVPKPMLQGTQSAGVHNKAYWLRHPCLLGDPQRLRAGGGGGVSNGPQQGVLATSRLPSRGSPSPRRTGHNQQWPRTRRMGYVTLAF